MTHTPDTPTPGSGPARYQQIDQGQLDAWRRKGTRNMGFGALWLVAGLLITLITMSTSDGRHGFYIIAFGPIIGGAIQIISGYRTHQRGATTPPSPAAGPRSAAAPARAAATSLDSAASRTASSAAVTSIAAESRAGLPSRAWHPVQSITRGMSGEEVRRRLGEPTSRTASPSAGTGRADVIWVYQDSPPGQHTEIGLGPDGEVADLTSWPGSAPGRTHDPAAEPALASPASATPPAEERTAGCTSVTSGASAEEPGAAAGSGSTPRLLRRSAARAQTQGDLTEAKTLHQQVIDTGHPVVAPASMLDLAGLLEADGDTTGAAHLLEQAIEVGDAEQVAAARGHLERLALSRALAPAGVTAAAAASPASVQAPEPPPTRARAGTATTTTPRATSNGRRKHAWAEEFIEEHLSKVEEHDPVLAARRTWPLLRRSDVLDYVLSGEQPHWTTGRVGTRGALFDGLYVAVSNLPTHRPHEMRPLLRPEGYPGLVRRLVAESRTIETRVDVAHWVLGTSSQGWAAHLLYMPPPTGIPLSWDKGEHTLFPWDLFLPEERPH